MNSAVVLSGTVAQQGCGATDRAKESALLKQLSRPRRATTALSRGPSCGCGWCDDLAQWAHAGGCTREERNIAGARGNSRGARSAADLCLGLYRAATASHKCATVVVRTLADVTLHTRPSSRCRRPRGGLRHSPTRSRGSGRIPQSLSGVTKEASRAHADATVALSCGSMATPVTAHQHYRRQARRRGAPMR